MTDLGTLGGDNSYAYGLNYSGKIVGDSDLVYEGCSIGNRAFSYENGIMIEHGTLNSPYTYSSSAISINDNNQFVGESKDNSGHVHAFLYNNGIMTDLGTLGGLNSTAQSINNSGQIVGWSLPTSGDYHAFLYEKGVMKDLGTFGGISSQARDINNNGEVVGYYDLICGYNPSGPDFCSHGFLYEDGLMKDLGTLSGGKSSAAYGINNVGQIVGWSTDSHNNQHAVLWNPVGTPVGTPVAPEPIGSILFVTGGILLAGRRLLERAEK